MSFSANTDFLPPNDTRLNNVSREITLGEIGCEFLNSLCSKMKNVAMGERDAKHPDLPSLVGLAAPQIGQFVRVILFDIKTNASTTNLDPDLRFIINPRVIKTSEERELGREGCYSTGNVQAVIKRHTSITVSGLDMAGDTISYDLEGFHARIVQHEIDHLSGVRCPDRIDSLDRLHQVSKEEFQDYRENWATWDKYYDIEDWLSIKRGEQL